MKHGLNTEKAATVAATTLLKFISMLGIDPFTAAALAK
jgi:hypothetical protein